jgi:hypothetical protein
MSTPTYADDKKAPAYADGLDSDNNSLDTLTALIVEGENQFNPAHWSLLCLANHFLVCLDFRSWT